MVDPQRHAYVPLLSVAALIVALDQATKQWALERLSDGSHIDLIEGVLRLRLAFNPGGAFGIGRSTPAFFLVASIVVVALILYWARRPEHRAWAVPLGAVLGGGLGNLTDRVIRDHHGRVVDFIDLHVWPVFNLADSAIVLGVATLLIFGTRGASEAEPSSTAEAGSER